MAQVELILGPAGAGKTAHVLSVFQDAVQKAQKRGEFGTAIWIAPTQRARRAVAASITNDELPVCFAPHIVTFDEFAERLLKTASGSIRPIGQIAKKKLLRDLIDQLAQQKRLPYFETVASTPGFLELCVTFISELKREEIWPEHFLEANQVTVRPNRAPKFKRTSSKELELGLIYAKYQEMLHRAGGAGDADFSNANVSGLYDAEGRFWSARTLLREGHCGPFKNAALVVVDGFTDFTRTQYEILAELARRCQQMLITLPMDYEGERRDLFAKTYAAYEELGRAFQGCECSETRLDLSSAKKRSLLGHLSSHLFDNPRQMQRFPHSQGIKVLSCIRTTGEINELARRIKEMLIDGISPDDIVVAYRSLDGVADLIRTTFQSCGIPIAIEVGHSIASAGPVRIAFLLLDLEREDWSFPRLMALLNSPLFRPSWPDFQVRRAAKGIGEFLRRFDIDHGRGTILSSLEYELARRQKEVDDAELYFVCECLNRLSNLLGPLRERNTFPEWVDTWLAIVDELGICPSGDDKINHEVSDSLAAAEWGIWQSFIRLLEEAKRADDLFVRNRRQLSLNQFQKQVAEILEGQTWDEGGRDEGKVRIVNAEQVRALDVPHLFLCGLNEGQFPTTRNEDCFLSENDRQRLIDKGLPLGHRARHSREEMLLFYGVVTRARTSLTLSYSSLNDSGETLNRSPFLSAVIEVIGENELHIEQCGRLAPIPENAAECVTVSDLRVFAMAQALEGKAGLFATIASRSETAPTCRSINAAVAMATARFSAKGLTNYEGLLSDPRNLKRLRQRFGPKHEFSVTELEAYARNPFRFFLSNVLGLESPSIPGPRTNYARRGSELHSILAKCHREFADRVSDVFEADTLEELLRGEALHRSTFVTDSVLHRVLRDVEREVLLKLIRRYSDQWNAYLDQCAGLLDSPPKPTYLEIPFGNAPPDDAEGTTVDQAQSENPVVAFGSQGRQIRLRGRIDRIDTASRNSQTVFTVVDYKLSRQPARFLLDDVRTGLSLQLPVYSIAAQRLGLVDGNLLQFGFWSLTGDGFTPGLKARSKRWEPLDDNTMTEIGKSLDQILPNLVDRIRDGIFPVVEDDTDRFYPDCTAVARVTSWRPMAEVLQKQAPPIVPHPVDATV